MESENKNLFITGKAGAGKSILLSYFCQNTKKYAVLAPTGVAALNVKGQTIRPNLQERVFPALRFIKGD